MYAKVMSFVFRAATVLSLFLSSGCAAVQLSNLEPAVGEVFAMSNGATQLNVIKTLAGGSQGFILQNGDKFMFYWPLRDNHGVAFWGLDVRAMRLVANRGEMLKFISGMGGQVGNCLETTCLVDWMKNNGWKLVGASELSLAVKDSILVIVTTPVRCLPTFVLMPVGTGDLFLDRLYPEPIQE
jgi:hypothetical protein